MELKSYNLECLNSNIIRISVDIFYLLGGFLTFFGIILNFLCYLVVRYSKVYNKTCYGLYLRFICITDIFKLIAEYHLRILIMYFYNKTIPNLCILNYNLSLYNEANLNFSYDNLNITSKYNKQFELVKFFHCNFRLGVIMITENLSYIYCIFLAADRVLRLRDQIWAKRVITLKLVKKLILIASIGVVLYCHPHFYPIDKYDYINYQKSYIIKMVYSECMVLSNKWKYVSFPFYWNYIESFVNSLVLPSLLVILNIILSYEIFWKCKGSNFQLTNFDIFKTFNNKPKKKILKDTREACFIVLADSLLFIIVITPVNAFTYFYRVYDPTSENISKAFSLIGITVSLVNHSFNGIIFLICSKTFRSEFIKILRFIFFKTNSKIDNY